HHLLRWFCVLYGSSRPLTVLRWSLCLGESIPATGLLPTGAALSDLVSLATHSCQNAQGFFARHLQAFSAKYTNTLKV
ncbi:hypothetical protein, partial [Geobacter sp. OR-1]|uniref:hypothetical protein n=1 Tax=Geobacter sp. OR-1 TaxID=1266765 RepID=UPI001ED98F32